MTQRLFDELPLAARRLAGEEQELFHEANRMQGEVEFRYALPIPIAVAVSVLAFGLGFPLWAWALVSLAGFAAGYALLSDGWRRDAARKDFLVELLAIDKAKSPTFERLRERAELAERPGRPVGPEGEREVEAERKSTSTSPRKTDDAVEERDAGARAARCP